MKDPPIAYFIIPTVIQRKSYKDENSNKNVYKKPQLVNNAFNYDFSDYRYFNISDISILQ